MQSLSFLAILLADASIDAPYFVRQHPILILLMTVKSMGKMGNHKVVSTSLVLAVAAGSLLLIWHNTISHANELGFTSWALYEWLINYQAGFIRRGLIGELLHQNFLHNELPAINTLVFWLAFAFIGLIVHMLLTAKIAGHSAVLVIFAPTGFFWAAITNEYYYRKEIIFYLAILLVCALYRKLMVNRNPSLAKIIIFLIGFFSLVLPFIHESFCFFASLIFSLVLVNALTVLTISGYKRWLQAYIGLNLLVFLVQLVFKGNADISQTIWLSISDEVRRFSNNGVVDGGILAIGWSALTGVSMSVRAILSGLASYYLWPLAMVFLTNAYIYSEKYQQTWSETFSSSLFVGNFALVCATFSPLFLLGWDYGRWIFGIGTVFTVMNYSELFLAIDKFTWVDCVKAFFGRHKHKMIFGLLLILSLVTRLPECCLRGSGDTLMDNKVTQLLINTLKH